MKKQEIALLVGLAMLILSNGCSSAPVVTETIKPPVLELPEGCTRSTISKPGDEYSYQGPLRPSGYLQRLAVHTKAHGGSLQHGSTML